MMNAKMAGAGALGLLIVCTVSGISRADAAEDEKLVEIRLEGLDETLVEPVRNSLTLYQQNSHDRLNRGRIEPPFWSTSTDTR